MRLSVMGLVSMSMRTPATTSTTPLRQLYSISSNSLWWTKLSFRRVLREARVNQSILEPGHVRSGRPREIEEDDCMRVGPPMVPASPRVEAMSNRGVAGRRVVSVSSSWADGPAQCTTMRAQHKLRPSNMRRDTMQHEARGSGCIDSPCVSAAWSEDAR